MLVTILIGVAVVLFVFGAVAARRPSAYHVQRPLEIAAPADRVFGVLNDLNQFARVLVLFGSPWENGNGTMTIDESVPGRKVRVRLEFVKPMKSTAICVLTLVDTPTGTVVTWSMDGNHNFIGKAVGMFMNMDDMLGADIEKGLTQLKTVAEG